MPDIASETIQRTSPMRVSPRHLTKLEKAMRLTVQSNAEHDPPFVLWVSGKAGVGKSTLIQAAARVLEGEGAIVVNGEAFPHTGEILEPIL